MIKTYSSKFNAKRGMRVYAKNNGYSQKNLPYSIIFTNINNPVSFGFSTNVMENLAKKIPKKKIKIPVVTDRVKLDNSIQTLNKKFKEIANNNDLINPFINAATTITKKEKTDRFTQQVFLCCLGVAVLIAFLMGG